MVPTVIAEAQDAIEQAWRDFLANGAFVEGYTKTSDYRVGPWPTTPLRQIIRKAAAQSQLPFIRILGPVDDTPGSRWAPDWTYWEASIPKQVRCEGLLAYCRVQFIDDYNPGSHRAEGITVMDVVANRNNPDRALQCKQWVSFRSALREPGPIRQSLGFPC